MDIDSIKCILSDYEYLVEVNSNREEDDSIWATDFDHRSYDNEDAQLIDSLVVPFGEKTGVDVLKSFYEYRDKGLDFVSDTFKGHDKEYYEALRVKYNEEIANEPDSLKKLKLIEKYSKELYEASRCLMLLELVEMINKGGIF